MADNAKPVEARKVEDRTHYLYIAVIVAMLAGIAVGALWPEFGKDLKWLGTLFVNLIKMMIAPIFCTIVLGIGSARAAAQVGRVGGIALVYFVVTSTLALAIGLLVGNIIKPGDGLHLTDELAGAGAEAASAAEHSGGTTDFILGLIPTTLPSALTSGSVLQALLVGFALQKMGRKGESILRDQDGRGPVVPADGDDHGARADRGVRSDGGSGGCHRPGGVEVAGSDHGALLHHVFPVRRRLLGGLLKAVTGLNILRADEVLGTGVPTHRVDLFLPNRRCRD
jgi:hypothetical protein